MNDRFIPKDPPQAVRVRLKEDRREEYRGRVMLGDGRDIIDAGPLLVVGGDESSVRLKLFLGAPKELRVDRVDIDAMKAQLIIGGPR